MRGCAEAFEQKLNLYRAWVVSESEFFRRALKRISKNTKVDYSDEIEAFFSVLGGQRSSKEGVLPSMGYDCSLSALDRADLTELILNLQGRQQLISMLAFPVRVISPEGVRSSVWRKKWIPLAENKSEKSGTILFVDNDPEPGFPAGRLVEEHTEIGWSQGQIDRLVVASSLDAYFQDLNEAAAGRQLEYKSGVGVLLRSKVTE